MAVRIGELLLKEKLITPEQLQQALTQQKANGAAIIFAVSGGFFSSHEAINPPFYKEYLQRGYTVFSRADEVVGPVEPIQSRRVTRVCYPVFFGAERQRGEFRAGNAEFGDSRKPIIERLLIGIAAEDQAIDLLDVLFAREI